MVISTFSVQYTHFHSQKKPLLYRARRVCSINDAFKEQIKNIKEPVCITFYWTQTSTKQKTLNSNINKTKEQTVDAHKKIWLNLLYVGDKGDQ